MEVSIDLEKMQMVIYYLNNVRMSNARREELHSLIIEGILKGSLDMEAFSVSRLSLKLTGVECFVQEMRESLCDQGWIQAESLYDQYVSWCGRSGRSAQPRTSFGQALIAGGIRKKSKSDANYYAFEEELLAEA